MMPTTKGQRVFFTALNAVLMTYGMSLFNAVLNHGGILRWEDFGLAGIAFLKGAPVSFLLQVLFLQNIAARMTAQYPTENQLVYYAMRTGITVLLVCPVLSLYNNALNVGLNPQLILVWFSRLVVNFPFAFFLQLFFVGPLSRTVLKAVCRPEEKAAVA